jgi:hypothetical protein
MISKISMAVIGAAMLMVCGCDLGPPLLPPPQPPPQPAAAAGSLAAAPVPLTAGQITAVLNCQETIKSEGLEFTRSKEKKLNECLDEVLELQLPFENGLIDAAHYNTVLAQVRSDCAQRFQQIGRASTDLVNDIVAACGPVQSLILPNSGYDPLQFGALARSEHIILVADATGLAGRICGAKELFVDALVGLQVPRMVGLLKILDNGTGQFAITGPSSSLLGLSPILPNIPLDTRCILPQLP